MTEFRDFSGSLKTIEIPRYMRGFLYLNLSLDMTKARHGWGHLRGYLAGRGLVRTFWGIDLFSQVIGSTGFGVWSPRAGTMATEMDKLTALGLARNSVTISIGVDIYNSPSLVTLSWLEARRSSASRSQVGAIQRSCDRRINTCAAAGSERRTKFVVRQ